MDFIKNLQLAAAASIADIGLLAGFMVVNVGRGWLERNVTPSIPGGLWAQTLGSSAMEAAGDLSKFVLFDLATNHGAATAAATTVAT